MGGAGVLCAAARECRGRVACVVAANPAFAAVETRDDHRAEVGQ